MQPFKCAIPFRQVNFNNVYKAIGGIDEAVWQYLFHILTESLQQDHKYKGTQKAWRRVSQILIPILQSLTFLRCWITGWVLQK